MNDDFDVMKWLALIKYHYQLGCKQVEESYPYHITSVLYLHDAIEWWFDLAIQKMNISLKGDRYFNKSSWQTLNDKVKEAGKAELSEDVGVFNVLSKLRDRVKHERIQPAKDQLIECKNIAERFFTNNTPIVFDIEFDEISMIQLVKDDEIRRYLEKSQNFLKEDDFKEAIHDIAKAFYLLKRKYEHALSQHKPMFMYNKAMIERCGYNTYEGGGDNFYELRKAVLDLIDQTRFLDDELLILSMQIDFLKFKVYQKVAPQVAMIMNGKGTLDVYELPNAKYDETGVRYCFDFVLETALMLQEKWF